MSQLRLRFGVLNSIRARRPGATEWDVTVEDVPSRKGQAISFDGLTEELEPGDAVLLNTAAVALGLGTGGLDLVVSRLGRRFPFDPFDGPGAGHLMKLRYTPLQHRVLSVEEEASPHRSAIDGFHSLDRTPVICAELHSQMAAAAIAARAVDPAARIVYVMTDSAALPAGLSRLAAALREQGVLQSVITSGQAFGGDHEAVNLHTALIAARVVEHADLVLVAQGPGNVGTGTDFGFSGLALLEALHAAEALGGRPILVPRLSSADPRPRHQGLSHHTATLLRLVRCPVEVPLPILLAEQAARVREQMSEADPQGRHRTADVDSGEVWPKLLAFRPVLTSMGRGVAEDPAFFAAAAASGVWATRNLR